MSSAASGSRGAASAPAPASNPAPAPPLLVKLSTVDGRDVVVDVQPGHTLLSSVQRALLTQRAMEQLQLLRRVRGVSTGATEAFTANAHVLRGGLHVPVTLDSTDRAPQIARKVNDALRQGVATAAPAPTVSVAQSVAAYEHKTKAAAAADANHRLAGALGKGQRSVYALRTDARSDSLLRQQPHVHAAAVSAAAAAAAAAANGGADAEDDDAEEDDDDAAADGAGKEEEVWLPPVATDDDDDAAAAFTPDMLAAKLGAAAGVSGPTRAADVTEAQCRRVFDRFDRNGDGHIDADELEGVCAATGVKPWRALKELDADRDGRISWAEFVGWWKRDRARCALESAAGISYENVHAFRAAPLERRRGSRNLHALTAKRDSLTAPPRLPDDVAPAHTVTDADVAAAATHRRTDSGGRSLSGAAAASAGGAAGAGAAAANGDASLRRASAAALGQMGSQLAAAARVAHGLEMTPQQRAEVTNKFRAVQFAVHDLETYLTRLLADD